MKIFRTDVTRTQSSKHHDTGGDVNRKHVLRSARLLFDEPDCQIQGDYRLNFGSRRKRLFD